MNNIFVYIENEGGKAAEVCLELMTKGRELATTLGVKLEAVVLGENLAGIEHELAKYGADTVWIADDKVLRNRDRKLQGGAGDRPHRRNDLCRPLFRPTTTRRSVS